MMMNKLSGCGGKLYIVYVIRNIAHKNKISISFCINKKENFAHKNDELRYLELPIN
jgi:hypothetical protein